MPKPARPPPVVAPEPRTFCARDLMERDIVTVTPETKILDVHRLFVEEEIHGAPVVDDDGRVVGVISTLDLLRIVRDEDHLDELTAADAMTRELVAIGPDASVDEIARTMHDQRIHRVLVCEDGTLLGLVTTFDLLRAVDRGTTSPLDPDLKRTTGYRR